MREMKRPFVTFPAVCLFMPIFGAAAISRETVQRLDRAVSAAEDLLISEVQREEGNDNNAFQDWLYARENRQMSDMEIFRRDMLEHRMSAESGPLPPPIRRTHPEVRPPAGLIEIPPSGPPSTAASVRG